jgi:hypothetical protein
VRVDPENAIAEPDENDNAVTTIFTAAAPQLAEKFVFPVIGEPHRDWIITNYVDVDARPEMGADYRGGPFQYDGHNALDIGLARNFKAMDHGFPVVARASGVVREIADGNFDRQNIGSPKISASANYVVIDHGNEFFTYYWHLAANTITVNVGDHVRQGQLLALVGSSGTSSGAHLHTSVRRNGTSLIDPSFAPEFYLAKPIAYTGDLATTVLDSGITNYEFPAMTFGPGSSERKEGPSEVRLFPVSRDGNVTYWATAIPLALGDSIETRWLRPDGTLEKTDTQTFDGPEQIVGGIPRITVPELSFTRMLEHSRWSRFPGMWSVALVANGNELDRQSFEVTTGQGLPEIRLTQRETYIIDGRTTPIDYRTVSETPRPMSFSIQNHGSVELTTSELELPPGFSLVGQFPSSVPAGATAEFTVQLDNTVPGQKFGQVRFHTNDADEAEFTFNVKGRVTGSPPTGSPAIARTDRPAATYINSDEPALFAQAATITDDDSANFNSGRLIVEFASGASPDDQLSIRSQGTDAGQISVDGNSVSFGGVAIASISRGGSSNLIHEFNSNASPPAVEALVRNLTFSNLARRPATNIRFVRLTLIDDTGKPSNMSLASIVIDPRIGGASSGDFNSDGTLTATDIDLIYAAISSGSTEVRFDLNRDSRLDPSDVDELIRVLLGTSYGDANLDGTFDSSDLVQVFQAGQYEDSLANDSTWSTGDWDGDQDFGTSDLVLAFQMGVYLG